jgi:dihydroorotase
MKYDLVIEGNVFYKDGLTKCCIAVEDGVVKEVKKVLKGRTHLDVGDKLVLPGAIDPHVHLREPGFTEKEDFSTGTLSAVFGGVTTVLDMPNNRPPTTTVSALVDKFERVKGRANVDYGLFCGLSPKTKVGKAAPLSSGFKIYLGETTGDLHVRDPVLLKGALAEMAEHGSPVSIHCEDPLYMPKPPKVPGSIKGPVEYNKARPEEMEAATVRMVTSLEEARRAKVHIAHISSPSSLEAMTAGSTCEVTPHHIYLSATNGLKAKGKMNPPLREEPTTQSLRKAYYDGRIDIVASDHAPHTIEEKEVDFAEAPAGVPGVETMLPLLLYAVRSSELPIERVVDSTSRRTAQIFRIEAKGAISKGMDADIITIDLRKVVKIRGAKLHSKAGWTPFEGHDGIFPKNVFLRGQQVIQDWEFVGDQRWGLPLKVGVPGRNKKE